MSKQAPKRVRPRDAASLIVVRKRKGEHEVLLGRRSAGDRFLPGVFVFPGGAVDRVDYHTRVGSELHSREAQRLHGVGARTRSLAVAAVRETYEETGLLFGKAGANALIPELGELRYIARAITPAQSTMRYNARFFMASAEGAKGRLRSNGELSDLAWLRFDRALELPMIDVTKLILELARDRLAGRQLRGIPLIYYRQGRRILRYE